VTITEETPRNYREATQTLLSEAKELFLKLEDHQGEVKFDYLEDLDRLGYLIGDALGRAHLYTSTHPIEGVRDAAENAIVELEQLVTAVSMSPELFENIKKIDAKHADKETTKFYQDTLRNFRRSGVDRDEKKRRLIVEFKDQLTKLSQQFGKHIREDIRSIVVSEDELTGLPEDYRAGKTADSEGNFTITTDYPDYLPFMKYAENDDARRRLFTAFKLRAHPTNAPVLHEILVKRHKLAKLLGHKSWADFITDDKMSGSGAHVRKFIDKIVKLATKESDKEQTKLLKWAHEHLGFKGERIEEWQYAFLSDRYRQATYGLTSEEIRAFFPYEQTRDGILAYTSQLFGLKFEPNPHAPRWHVSVDAYEVYRDDTHLGRFYLDMHPRPGKFKHAAVFPIQGGKAGQHFPMASLVCNFPEGQALMEHQQVVTFFHEMGHLLHHILGGQQRWAGQSGIETEWDFVETPPQILEEWAWKHDVLSLFAKNSSGETITEKLVTSMKDASEFGKSIQAHQQMFYARLSLDLHQKDMSKKDPVKIAHDIQLACSPWAPVDDTFMIHSFGHLDGYSALYYTYMWSLVIAKDLYGEIESADTKAKRQQKAYQLRDKVLSPGGSQTATEMIEAFLGRPSDAGRFEQWLNQ